MPISSVFKPARFRSCSNVWLCVWPLRRFSFDTVQCRASQQDAQAGPGHLRSPSMFLEDGGVCAPWTPRISPGGGAPWTRRWGAAAPQISLHLVGNPTPCTLRAPAPYTVPLIFPFLASHFSPCLPLRFTLSPRGCAGSRFQGALLD